MTSDILKIETIETLPITMLQEKVGMTPNMIQRSLEMSLMHAWGERLFPSQFQRMASFPSF